MPGFQGGLVRRIRDDTDAEVYHLRKREAVHLGTGPFGFLYTRLRPPFSEEAHPTPIELRSRMLLGMAAR